MSHDKIRDAARKRRAETGEPYVVARREVIKAARGQIAPSDESTGPAAGQYRFGKINTEAMAYLAEQAGIAKMLSAQTGIGRMALDIQALTEQAGIGRMILDASMSLRDSWPSS